MIWNPNQFGGSARDAAVDGIVEELQALCGKSLGGGEDALAEVAMAVEATLEETPGAAGEDGVPGGVVALATKALWAIGETRAARRLGLLGAGVIRPGEWSVAGGATLWIVDLRPLCPAGGVVMELQVLASLDMILDCIADVWDDTEGRGLLGLQHLSELARRMNRGRKRGHGALKLEIREVCVARLMTLARRRGWVERPELMALDVRG